MQRKVRNFYEKETINSKCSVRELQRQIEASLFERLNEVKELEKAELMPAKWQVLIELSQQLILSKQTT